MSMHRYEKYLKMVRDFTHKQKMDTSDISGVGL